MTYERWEAKNISSSLLSTACKILGPGNWPLEYTASEKGFVTSSADEDVPGRRCRDVQVHESRCGSTTTVDGAVASWFWGSNNIRII